MTLGEQFQTLIKVKSNINKQLLHLDREAIKSLLLTFAKDSLLKKLAEKDNQLFFLNSFCNIWLEEQKQYIHYKQSFDIFYDISSLADVEEKYISIWFYTLRFETKIPHAYRIQALQYFSRRHISGVALCYIAHAATAKPEQNLLKIAREMMYQQDYVSACILLQELKRRYPFHVKVLRTLSRCWSDCRQWEPALQCLRSIRHPSKSDLNTIQKLKGILANDQI